MTTFRPNQHFPMRLIVILAVAIISLASKCKEAPEGLVQVDYEEAFILAPGESAAIQSSQEIGFRFDAITAESRCPMGVNCMRAGEVKFRITLPDGSSQEIEHPAGSRSPTTFSLASGAKVRVISVDPYPDSSERTPFEEYKLQATIMRTNRNAS